MNSDMLIGMLVGVMGCIILVILLLLLTKKDFSLRCKYDERQQFVRGKGFKFGFFTLMVYNILYGCADVIMEKQFMDNMMAMFLGISLSAIVYVSYCVWNEGYFSLNENPKRVMSVFAMLAALNFLLAAVNISRGMVIEDGIITYRCVNLLCGIMFLIIFMVVFAKWLCNRREVE